MVKPVRLGNNNRMTFSKINEVIDMPNLIEIQKDSYKWFVEAFHFLPQTKFHPV